jgi:NAD(P)-dependent dehydrogenase (short-subunit alcohol dehydrogenase family)
MSLQGKVLILTGSTGIAAAAARLAAAAGARLLVAAADEDSGWELAAETGAECWVGDLARPASADSILSQCLAKFARVDGLFQASGLSGRRFGDGPVHECTDEGWEVTIAHNLRVVFQTARAVIGRMLQQEAGADGIRGSIVTLGSALAASPEPKHFAHHAYAAAKGGVASLSLAMAAYYAPMGIRINVVAPAMVRTPVSARAEGDAELAGFLAKKQPLAGGMVEPDGVARAALFLLGDDSRFTTGEILTVDGGWHVSSA